MERGKEMRKIFSVPAGEEILEVLIYEDVVLWATTCAIYVYGDRARIAEFEESKVAALMGRR